MIKTMLLTGLFDLKYTIFQYQVTLILCTKHALAKVCKERILGFSRLRGSSTFSISLFCPFSLSDPSGGFSETARRY